MSIELTPAQRLALSRERLRQALCAVPAPPGAASSRGEHASRVTWRHAWSSVPGGEHALQALRRWWARQPWRAVSEVLLDGANLALQPVARRNPLGLMLGALVMGGLLARLRPWRWIPKSVLFAGLLPQFLPGQVAAQAISPSWGGVLLSLLRQARRPD